MSRLESPTGIKDSLLSRLESPTGIKEFHGHLSPSHLFNSVPSLAYLFNSSSPWHLSPSSFPPPPLPPRSGPSSQAQAGAASRARRRREARGIGPAATARRRWGRARAGAADFSARAAVTVPMADHGVVAGKRTVAGTFSRLREQGKVRAFDLPLHFVRHRPLIVQMQ